MDGLRLWRKLNVVLKVLVGGIPDHCRYFQLPPDALRGIIKQTSQIKKDTKKNQTSLKTLRKMDNSTLKFLRISS